MKAPFRRRILLYSSALLVALIVAMLLSVNYSGEGFVRSRIEKDIADGRQRVARMEQQRTESLWLTANFVVGSFVNLKPLLLEPDGWSTIRDSLLTYEQQNRKRDVLLVVFDAAGRLVARTDKAEATPIPDIAALLREVPEQPANVVVKVDGAPHHVAVVPLEAAGSVYGYIAAGLKLDDVFARSLQGSNNDTIVIASGDAIVSTLPESANPLRTQQEWAAKVPPDTPPAMIDAGSDSYQAVATLLGGGTGLRPLAVVMQSHNQAMEPYKRIQYLLLIVGAVIATIGVGLSAVLAKNVTAPVAKLVEGTREVAAGNFDYRLDIQPGDEIGELAQSFNVMTQGLRERADMQKFVSQSTVDMIQSSEQKKVSAGERVTLTVLFTDMRGFTSMSENRRPEDIVKMLNACLSLQADKVKKFHGDIDKYVGDCVVALFDGDDMELNATRCAVEIHRALDALNAANPNDQPLRVGIGIVTGEVILGSIGSADRLDYTVIGSNVNLCSRLCSSAGPRETLLSQSTFSRLEGLVAAEKLEPIHVKGFTEPVPVYRMR